MPTTIPKNLFDYLISEQISAGRFASGQVHDVIDLLNAADKEILAKITARGNDGTFTSYRLKALLKEIKATVDAAYWQAEKQLHESMGGYAIHSAEATAGMLAAQLPVTFSIVGMSDTQLAAIVDTTPISIGPDKKLLLEEVFSKLAAGKEEAIRGAIRLSMVQGETVPEMVRRLQGSRASRYTDGIFEKHRQDAAKIVRTVVQHTNNQAAQQTFKNNSEVVKGWVYVATLDSRTCPVCFSQSGKSFPLGSGPLPPQHISCRCFQTPDIMSWKELGIDREEFPPAMRASSSGLVSADISFGDWLKTQDKATQAELLGKSRQKLFTAGGLKLDKFTDQSGELYTLDVLKQRHAAAFKAAFG